MFVFVVNDNELSIKMFEDIGDVLPKMIIRPVKEIEQLIKDGNLILMLKAKR